MPAIKPLLGEAPVAKTDVSGWAFRFQNLQRAVIGSRHRIKNANLGWSGG